ncbi:B-cell receptor-associated 31 domain containing protein [Aphelenchoides bicaudatus]|nr:B-cell receptor-associated 31 domain containing protein [Aphelenchoides bicaudatus]
MKDVGFFSFLPRTMTLQWSVVAGILYVEVAVLLLLLLPWIRPQHWKKLFNSRLVHAISRFANIYSYAIVAVLLLLFLDAVREVRKYSEADIALETRRALENDSIVHMRLFRAQRNLYISGFSLLLFLVINRIVSLISRTAQLQAAYDAAIRQAEGANKAAKTLLEAGDNDALEKATKETEELKKKLRKAEQDRDAMKKQSENLQGEYDRVCSLLNDAERKAGGDKKDD